MLLAQALQVQLLQELAAALNRLLLQLLLGGLLQLLFTLHLGAGQCIGAACQEAGGLAAALLQRGRVLLGGALHAQLRTGWAGGVS